MTKNQHAFNISLAVWQALSFTLMGVWVRMMDGAFTPYQQVFWRSILAGLCCWIFFGSRFSKNLLSRLTRRDWIVLILHAFLAYGIGVLSFTIAILHADLAQVAFISSLPVAGPLAWLLFREKLARWSLPFIAISILGLFLVTGLTSASYHFNLGTIAAVVSMLGFSISYLMVRYHPKNLTTLHTTTLILSFGWIPAFMLMLVARQSILPAHINTVALVGLLFSVILNISGIYILNHIFKHLKAYAASNLLLLEGVFALTLGYMAYGEKLSALELLGAALIVLSAVALSAVSLRTQEGATPSYSSSL